MKCRSFLAILLAAGLCFCAPLADVRQAAIAPDAAAVSFWDHRASVRMLAFAPTGKTMATVTGDQLETVAVWDLATMTRKRELSGISNVSALAFSPDGRLLAAQGVVPAEGETSAIKPAVVVWDATTGKQRHTLDFPRNDQFLPLAFSPDGKSLAIAGADDSSTFWDSVTFWDLGTGKQRGVKLDKTAPQVGVVEKVSFAPDVKTAAGVAEQAVRVWDLATGKQKRSLPDPLQQVACFAFAPDGKSLAIGTDRGAGRPGELKLWDLVTDKERPLGKEQDSPIRAVAFSPDGKTLASTSANGTVRMRDLASGKETAAFEVPADTTRLAFSPDGKLLVAFGGQTGARLWDVTTGKERLSPAEEAERDRREAIYRKQQTRQEQARAAQARERNTAKKRLDPVGRSLLEEEALRARRAEYALLMSQAQRASERWQFKEASELLNSLRPDKGEQDLRGFDWHHLHGQLPRETVLVERGDDRIGAAAVSPDGEVVVLALPEKKKAEGAALTLFDTQTGHKIGVLGACKLPVHALAFSPDRLLLASTDGRPDNSETEIKLWDTTRRRLVVTLRGHRGLVSALQFAPDGRTLASAGEDRTLRLWDVRTGKLRHSKRRQKKVSSASVAFSPDGRTLAAGATGTPVRLWDVETGNRKGELPFLKDATAIAFAPFTRHLATSHGETVVLWDAATLRPVGSFQAPEGSLLFVDHGQQLLCNLALFDPLTGTERARWDHRLVPLRVGGNEPVPVTSALDKDVDVVGGQIPPPRPPGGDDQTLLAVGVSGSDRVVAVLSDARTVRLVGFRLRDEPRRLDGPDSLEGLAFSRDGKSLLALGYSELSRWDAITGRSTRSPFRLGAFGGRFLHVFHFKDKGQSVVSVHGVELPLADFVALGGAVPVNEEQDSFLRALALSPDGRTLATANYAPTVIDGMEPPNLVEALTLRDTSTGKVRATLKTGKISLSPDQATFSPDGHHLVTWGDDVVLWNDAGKEVDRIKPPGRVRAVRFGTDGHTPATLVVSDRDNSNVRLWDVATGEARAALRGLVGLTVLKFSLDGQTIVTGDEVGAVRLWDAHTGHLRLTLRGHRGSVEYLAFHPDGKALAVASSGSVSLWSVPAR